VTEDFFLEGLYGRSELGKTSFEKLSGNVELLTDDDRQFSYYNLSVGYNILRAKGSWDAVRISRRSIPHRGCGQFRLRRRPAFHHQRRLRLSDGGDDWLSLRIDVRDYVFESDLLGSNETLNNLEFTGGLTVFLR
jgi:hypothetical protein